MQLSFCNYRTNLCHFLEFTIFCRNFFIPYYNEFFSLALTLFPSADTLSSSSTKAAFAFASRFHSRHLSDQCRALLLFCSRRTHSFVSLYNPSLARPDRCPVLFVISSVFHSHWSVVLAMLKYFYSFLLFYRKAGQLWFSLFLLLFGLFLPFRIFI